MNPARVHRQAVAAAPRRVQSITVIACAVLAFGACRRDAGDRIEGTGTIEVHEVDVAPLAAARVARVLVDEGARVRAGDTLAILTTPTLGADIAQRGARVAEAEASLSEMQRGPRDAEIARAEADLRGTEAEAMRTAKDSVRYADLASRQVVSPQQLDAARAAARSAGARRDAARDALRLLREGTRPERVQAGAAQLANARASLAQAQATARDLVLLAPVAGTVLGRWAEPGEMLGPGIPAVTVGELARPWVRVYVAEPRLPYVRVGAPATVVLDGARGRTFTGRVVAINDRAEFTPRVALTEDERADLMFGIKVALDDSSGTLRPGLPVTVRITRTEPGKP